MKAPVSGAAEPWTELVRAVAVIPWLYSGVQGENPVGCMSQETVLKISHKDQVTRTGLGMEEAHLSRHGRL